MTIEARNLFAGYDGADIIRDVSLTVKPGRFLGIVGPNGCGKSTLLRVLSRTLRPRSGQVWLDDEPIERLTTREIARRLAFLPQSEPALFDFTARDIVLMGRHPHISGMRGETERDYEIAAESLAFTDTIHLAERVVGHISGGEHRRVLLARALAQQAPNIALDEPTAHLDAGHQIELLDRVRRLTRDRKMAVIAAMHDLNLAAEYCDQIVLLADGAVVAAGSPLEALTPANVRSVYGRSLAVASNPLSGVPWVFPHPSEGELNHRSPIIHVIAGGGAGRAVMSHLVRQGYQVTTGVLNRLDSDHEAALALHIPVVEEAPYSAIGEEAKLRCREMIVKAGAVVITEVPFGAGNLANLKLAAEALASGVTVILYGDTPAGARDFVNGEASRIIEQMTAGGIVVAPDLYHLDTALERLVDKPDLSS